MELSKNPGKGQEGGKMQAVFIRIQKKPPPERSRGRFSERLVLQQAARENNDLNRRFYYIMLHFKSIGKTSFKKV